MIRLRCTTRKNALTRLSLCLLGALPFCASLHAGAINATSFESAAGLITFDNVLGGNCNLCGPAITSQYSGMGVMFNDPTYQGDDTADSNLTAYIPGASPSNTLYVYQGGLIGDAPAAPFQIMFSNPVTMVGFNFGSATDAYLEMQVYNTSGVLIDTQDFTGSPAPIGLAGYAGVEESTAIGQVDVSYHLDSDPTRTLNFSIDNVQVEMTNNSSPVPEPSALTLGAIGLAGLVLARRLLPARCA